MRIFSLSFVLKVSIEVTLELWVWFLNNLLLAETAMLSLICLLRRIVVDPLRLNEADCSKSRPK